jgi:CBS domain-containing membrane protein
VRGHGTKLFETPFVFPSLGATAFLVFFTPTAPAASPRNTLCGHAVGIACGYAALVSELSWTRILAAALSLATTGALLILLDVPHPAAAATALIVSLGVVTRPAYLLVLEAAVGLLVGQAIVTNRLTGVRYPLWAAFRRRRSAGRPRGAHQRVARLLRLD